MSVMLAFVDWQTVLPFAVGVALALAVLGIAWLRQPRGLAKPPRSKTGSWEDAGNDDYANRRSSNRRDGQPVRVILSSPAFRNQMETGWVIDRSTGGLRIAMSKPIPVGSTLQVRAENAPNTIPWVAVTVRSCRDEGEHHEVGCSFESTPPWNVLLLFG